MIFVGRGKRKMTVCKSVCEYFSYTNQIITVPKTFLGNLYYKKCAFSDV